MSSLRSIASLFILTTTACSLLTSFDGFDTPKAATGPNTPACSATQLDCDNDPVNACETDSTRNARHCGSCRRDCLEGDCELGRCKPFALATNQEQPSRVVVDESHVYWTNQGGDGAVRRRAVGEGPVELVAVSNKPPGGLGADREAIYWSEIEAEGSLWRLPKVQIGTGVLPTELASGQGASVGLAVGADHVYWTTPGTVRRMPKAGGAIQMLAKDQGFPFSIVVDIGQVFWTNYQTGEVMSLLLARPDDAAPIAIGQGAPTGLAGDPTSLYWANNLPDSDGGPPAIKMIAKANASSPTTLASDQQAPVDVAVSGSDVFWTNSAGGTVVRAPKTGGAVEVLASGQGAPAGIAVTNGAVYWANRDDGRVMGVAR